MTDAEDDKAYEVGYRKPPKHSQFKKGQSGNPAGRPKGSKGPQAADTLARLLFRKVPVSEGGVARRLPTWEVICHRLISGAMSGDHRAMRELFRQMESLGIAMPRTADKDGAPLSGVLIVPEPCKSVEEWDALYGPGGTHDISKGRAQ
jgi:hypothetical protein